MELSGYQVKEEGRQGIELDGGQKAECRRKRGKKGKGWQGIGLPALWANVMVCGYFGRFGFF